MLNQKVRDSARAADAAHVDEHAVTIRALRKTFTTNRGAVNAVDDVDIEVGENEFICLLGPSGCGKTTTLRCIAGLERPDSGLIRIGGVPVYDSASRRYVPTERRGLGMVFQSYAIWPHMSVFDNVAYPLRHRPSGPSLSREEVRTRVGRILETVDCADLGNRRPGELSGGQQQRVALARALVYEPRVLLFDEPLSNLDAKLRERMRFELRVIQERAGFTAIYVTHDQEEALTLSDRIAVMADGRIRQLGTPDDVYERPADGFVADFIGAANIVPVSAGTVERGDRADTVLGPVVFGSRSAELAADDPHLVVIRPERVRLVEDGEPPVNVFDAVVLARAYRGDAITYTLAAMDLQVRVVDRSGRRYESGDKVRFHLPPEWCRLVGSGGFTARS